MHGKCPLSGFWSKASTAIHSVSDNPMGPFETAEVVIPSFAHNVKPFMAPDGKYLIYYIGSPNGDSSTCANFSRLLRDDPYIQPKAAAGPVTIASSDSLDVPADQWQHH